MSYLSGGTFKGVLRLSAPAPTPSVAPAGEGRIYFDGTTFQMSSDGGAFATIATVGAAGGWTDDGTVVRLTTVTDGVGIGTAALAASSKLEVLGDATRTSVVVTGGNPGGAGSGGSVSLVGGIGGATGTGGSVAITSGAGGSTSGSSGNVTLLSGSVAAGSNTGNVGLESGPATGSGSSGFVFMGSGPAVNGNTGDVYIYSNDASGSGSSGNTFVSTGAANSGDSGTMDISTSNSASGNSGDLVIRVGGSASAVGTLSVLGGSGSGGTDGGDVEILGGASGTASSQGGALDLIAGTTNFVTGIGGTTTIAGGRAVIGTGGNLFVYGGLATTGTGGIVRIDGGRAITGTGGQVLMGGDGDRSPTVTIGQSGHATQVVTIHNLGATQMKGGLTFTPDNTLDIGAVGATRPRRVYVGTEVVVGSTVTIGTAAVTGSGALAVNASSASSLWLGSTGLTSIQVGPGSGFLPTPGTGSVVLYPVTGVVAQSFLGLYSSDGTATLAGGAIDIEAGLGFAGVAAGDVTMTGGGINGGTRNGYLLIGLNHTDRVSIGNATVFGGDNGSAQQVDISTGGRIWAGASGSAPIQVGSANGTFDALAGDIVIASSPVVTGANYIGVYGGVAAAGFPGAYIDIIAGGGAPGLAAGDTFIRGGYADTGTAAGFLSLRGGDGNATVSANYVLAEGGQTTAAAGFGGDAILRGGDNLTTPANAGQVLIGVTTTRSITIGASGITTTVNGTLAATTTSSANYKTTVSTVSANVTLGATQALVLADSSGGGFTITLPTAASAGSGAMVTIKDSGGAAGTNSIVIDGNGAETIDGAANYTLTVNYESLELVCNGTAWFVV